MYHIGIVQHLIQPDKAGVISSDETVQAVIKMWDLNLVILGVDKKISKKVKKGDYILADYMPMAPESMNRRLSIVKIIPSSEGTKIWNEFQDEFRRRANSQQPNDFPAQRYIR